jgi:hypothetical protein
VALVPAGAGQPSRLEVDADPRTGGTEREAPQAVTIAIARGLRIDTRSRARLCSDAQARDQACPEESRIGRGHVEVTVSGYLMPGGSLDVISSLDAFLARPSQPGDIAAVVLQVKELVSEQQSFVRGRIVPVARGRFGTELRFDELPGGRAPEGGSVTSEVKRLRLMVRASRRANVVRRVRRRRVVRNVRLHLLRNPRTCRGSWPYELRVRFPSREERRPGAIACSAR